VAALPRDLLPRRRPLFRRPAAQQGVLIRGLQAPHIVIARIAVLRTAMPGRNA
jgi:hypothetical protein